MNGNGNSKYMRINAMAPNIAVSTSFLIGKFDWLIKTPLSAKGFFVWYCARHSCVCSFFSFAPGHIPCKALFGWQNLSVTESDFPITQKKTPVHHKYRGIVSAPKDQPLVCLCQMTQQSKNRLWWFFSHPDYTVGFGIKPNPPPKRVTDYTVGRDFHPAPKNLLLYLIYFVSLQIQYYYSLFFPFCQLPYFDFKPFHKKIQFSLRLWFSGI